MPRIGKRENPIIIEGKWYLPEVWYTQKRGFWYKGLPEAFVKSMDWDIKVFSKEADMHTALYRAVEEYHEMRKQIRKVISIKLVSSAQMTMNRTGAGSFSGIKDGVSKNFTHAFQMPDYSFGFDYEVLFEVSKDKKRYHEVTGDGELGRENSKNRNECMIIDWTQERENFLVDLGEKVQQLVYGVSSFFDSPEALKLMDSHGIKALEGPVPEDEQDDDVQVGDSVRFQNFGECEGVVESSRLIGDGRTCPPVWVVRVTKGNNYTKVGEMVEVSFNDKIIKI